MFNQQAFYDAQRFRDEQQRQGDPFGFGNGRYRSAGFPDPNMLPSLPSQQDYENFGRSVIGGVQDAAGAVAGFGQSAFNDVADKFGRAQGAVQSAATPLFDFSATAGRLRDEQNRRAQQRYAPPITPNPAIQNTGMHPGPMRGGMSQDQLADYYGSDDYRYLQMLEERRRLEDFDRTFGPPPPLSSSVAQTSSPAPAAVPSASVAVNSPPARQQVEQATKPAPKTSRPPRNLYADRLPRSGPEDAPKRAKPAPKKAAPPPSRKEARRRAGEAETKRVENQNKVMARQDAARKASHVPAHIQRKARALGYTGDFSDFDTGTYKDLKTKKRTERQKAYRTQQEERRKLRKAKYGTQRRQTGTERNRNRRRLGFAPDNSEAGRRRRDHESNLELMRAIRGR